MVFNLSLGHPGLTAIGMVRSTKRDQQFVYDRDIWVANVRQRGSCGCRMLLRRAGVAGTLIYHCEETQRRGPSLSPR
jgi:hypothetical protein